MTAKIVPDLFGVYAVDPGTTSAVAAGLFQQADGIAAALAAGEWEAWEVVGTPAEQAWEIMDEFRERQGDWNIRGCAVPDIHLVCENFQLSTTKAHGAGSSGPMLDPVRVMSGMEALTLRKPYTTLAFGDSMVKPWVTIQYQMPSEAKKYVTNERMRRWGAWTKGSEHRRDATRHMLKKVSDLLA